MPSQAKAATSPPASTREGSRWINTKPSSEELAAWFKDVKLHEGLDHADYIGGITVIDNKENRGKPNERIVYTPYPQVDIRIRYFHDLMTARDWIGVIEPVRAPRVKGEHLTNEHLPDWFFKSPVVGINGKITSFIGCAMRVRIFEKNSQGGRGPEISTAPPGTKVVPMLGPYGPDQHAMARAETGAVGRALGMAGMLVLPGSGIATAEDIHEALNTQPTVATPSLPSSEAATREMGLDLKDIAAALRQQLEEQPAKADELDAWAREKNIDLNNVADDQLRIVVRQMERKLKEPAR